MVGSVSRISWRSGTATDERCVSVPEALEAGAAHETIGYSLVVLRSRGTTASKEEYEAANVRVGDEMVTITSSGCGHSSQETLDVPVVVRCPDDQAARCGGCILNLANGEAIRSSMELHAPFISTSVR